MDDFSRYPRPFICLVRHGETKLSAARRYNGVGDVDLTAVGEGQARDMAPRFRVVEWEAVLCSPLKRARRTAELAGFPDPEIIDGLREFDYGAFEGKTTEEIFAERPGWDLWRDGCPDGETPEKAGKRLGEVAERLRAYEGAVLAFSHSHAIRILTAIWLNLQPENGAMFESTPAHVNVIGTHRGRPVIALWNDGSHLAR
jgi:probable phosphoglycerate mutase